MTSPKTPELPGAFPKLGLKIAAAAVLLDVAVLMLIVGTFMAYLTPLMTIGAHRTGG